MEAPPPMCVPVKIDPTGHIDQDINCIRCGYNLRGLSVEGICPECGTAVGRSFQGDLLRFAPPEWIEKLASGMNWILVGIVISIAFGVLASVVGSLTGMSGGFTVIAHAFGIFGVIGYWMVATPDPARLENESAISIRSLVRFTAVFNYGVGFAEAGAGTLGPEIEYPLMIAASLLGLVGYFAQFIYARRLALRIPNLRLAAQTRIVMWGLVVTTGLTLILGLLAVLVATPRGPGAFGPAALLACPSAIGILVFAIWSLVLLIWFRREFSDAAAMARRTWASSSVQTTQMPPEGPAW